MNSRHSLRGRSGLRIVSVPAITATVLSTALLTFSAPAMASGGGTSTGADLRLDVTLNPSQVPPGGTFKETYLIVNRGPDTAVAVRFQESMNTFFTYDSATVNGAPGDCPGTTDNSGNFNPECNVGDMLSGAQVTVVLTETAPEITDPFSNNAFVLSSTPDPLTTNNQAPSTVQVTDSGGGGGGGGTITPPPTSGPCASVQPSSASQTAEFTTVTEQTKVTNCGTDTLTDLVVMWNAGATAPANAHIAFDCFAPSSGSFTLAAGATLTVACKTNGFESGPTPVESGTGTVSVYDQCTAPNTTLVAGGVHCTDEPQTQLAQADFSWSLAIPSNPPARGGGRGGTG